MLKSAITLAIFLLASICQASTLSINIFAKVNGAPKHFENADGIVTGYAVEIAEEAVRRAGYKPNAIAMPWRRAQIESLAGRGIITSFSKTPARQLDYLFTEEMYVDRVVLVQHVDNKFPFNSFQDLQNKKIGLSRGSTYAGDFSKYRMLLELNEDDGHRQRLLKLSVKRIDAGIFSGDRFLVNFNIARADLSPKLFHIVEKPISVDPNYLGVPLSLEVVNPKRLRDQLNRSLSEMKVDGTIEAIRTRYAN